MREVIVFDCYELDSDDYEKPRGSIGMIDIPDTGNIPESEWVMVAWLPPLSGISGPIRLSDLKETRDLVVPNPYAKEPWGHKYEVHIYFEGEADNERWRKVADAINEAAPEAEFVGMRMNEIRDKPQDQGGS